MAITSTGLRFDAVDWGRSAVAPKPDLVQPSSVERSRSARFVYDREMKRSFVEFRDDESGRVISRFPAESRPDVTKMLDVLA